MAICSQYDEVKSYVTKDGSIIRELIHPNIHGNQNMSVAEATVPIGSSTYHHYHERSEEIYHITQGEGIVIVGEERVKVTVGHSVCLPPGVHHSVENTGKEELKFLCMSSPRYLHEDTVIVDKKNTI